ncbi:Conserved_hypothetical protein [Hexamita inflata]|uniref:Uncharacterized protein n=1 Tax=Hexamita inflata TaxID=28002 RepID=A0AA86TUJ7_9EUKA|nr:Conserved hypothetical protein [Hexamita inflata]
MFINIDQISNTHINITHQKIYIFSVFGLHQNIIKIVDTSINISVNTNVIKCALICLKCDVIIETSQLILTAQGQVVSGIALEIIFELYISKTSIQVRMSAVRGAGIVSIVQEDLQKYSISNSVLSVTSLLNSQFNGFLISQLNFDIDIKVNNLQVCSKLNQTGDTQSIVTITNLIVFTCNICKDNEYIVYGLCLQGLLNGINIDGVLECVFPFNFNGSVCICTDGYELNVSYCVNTVSQLTLLDENITTGIQQLDDALQQTKHDFKTELQQLQNLTQAEFAQLTYQYQHDIVSNISILETQFNASQTAQDNQLNSSLNIIDQRLFNNISSTKLYIDNQITQNATALSIQFANRIQISDELVVSNISHTEQLINTTRDLTELRIMSNFFVLKTQLQSETNTVQNNLIQNIIANSSVLEQRIAENATQLQNAITLLNTNTQNDIIALRNQAYTNLSTSVGQINVNTDIKIQTLKTYVDTTSLASDQRVVSNFTQLHQYVDSTRDATDLKIISNISALKNQLQAETSAVQTSIVQNIVSNSSTLETRIISNATLLQSSIVGLQTSTRADLEALRSQAFQNLTTNINTVNANIISNINSLNSNLLGQMLSNSTILEQRIIGNFSYILLLFQNVINQFQTNINQIGIDQTSNIVNTNNSKVIIDKLGQLLCSHISHAIYESATGKCICTVPNTQLQLNIQQCTCIIPNTAVINNQCACVIQNTILQANTCVCAIPGTSLVNNVCKCTDPNQILQNSACVSPHTHLLTVRMQQTVLNGILYTNWGFQAQTQYTTEFGDLQPRNVDGQTLLYIMTQIPNSNSDFIFVGIIGNEMRTVTVMLPGFGTFSGQINFALNPADKMTFAWIFATGIRDWMISKLGTTIGIDIYIN